MQVTFGDGATSYAAVYIAIANIVAVIMVGVLAYRAGRHQAKSARTISNAEFARSRSEQIILELSNFAARAQDVAELANVLSEYREKTGTDSPALAISQDKMGKSAIAASQLGYKLGFMLSLRSPDEKELLGAIRNVAANTHSVLEAVLEGHPVKLADYRRSLADLLQKAEPVVSRLTNSI